MSSKVDPLVEAAERLAFVSDFVRVSDLQRELGIGYTRASRMVEHLLTSGVLGEYRPGLGHVVLRKLGGGA